MQNPLTSGTSVTLIHSLTSHIAYIAFPFVILAIVAVGFMFIKAGGNSQEVTDSKKYLLWTLAGAVVILGMWPIIKIVGNIVMSLIKAIVQ